MIEIHSITDVDFHHNELPIVFHDDEYEKNYFCLSYDKSKIFYFSTESEIKPIAINIDGVIAVGCDQNVAFFSLKDNILLKKLSLSCFFYSFEVTNEYIIIVCEIEIILLKKQDLSEYKKFEFTEYIDHLNIDENNISIDFIDGSIEKVSI